MAILCAERPAVQIDRLAAKAVIARKMGQRQEAADRRIALRKAEAVLDPPYVKPYSDTDRAALTSGELLTKAQWDAKIAERHAACDHAAIIAGGAPIQDESPAPAKHNRKAELLAHAEEAEELGFPDVATEWLRLAEETPDHIPAVVPLKTDVADEPETFRQVQALVNANLDERERLHDLGFEAANRGDLAEVSRINIECARLRKECERLNARAHALLFPKPDFGAGDVHGQEFAEAGFAAESSFVFEA